MPNCPPCYEYCVKPVEVAAEVPEARLAAEPAVDEHVEAVDAKERGVALAAGEDVDGRVAEGQCRKMYQIVFTE